MINYVKKLIGYRYCQEMIVTKALGSYSQVDFSGVPVKMRKIAHLDEYGGCGCEWFTVEVAEDVLGKAG